jgi:hypothetical protein
VKSTKLVLAIAFVVVATLGLSACSSDSRSTEPEAVIAADYPYYDSVESLAASADLIVEATLANPTEEIVLPTYEGDDPKLNPYAGTKATPDPSAGAVPVTVYEASIKTVYQGNAVPGETIKVLQLGGTMNGVTYVSTDAPLKEGSSMLLFLHTPADAPADVLGGDVGAFVATDKGFASLGDSQLTLSQTDLASF